MGVGMSAPPIAETVDRRTIEGTAFSILAAISFSHLLNDTMQSLIPAIYPLLKIIVSR